MLRKRFTDMLQATCQGKAGPQLILTLISGSSGRLRLDIRQPVQVSLPPLDEILVQG